MNAIDRVFLPLARGPHSWFKDGQKTWELRRRGGAWDSKAIRVGRRVELRHGYKDRTSSLWGTIREVRLSSSVNDFFEKVPYQTVIPIADSHADGIRLAADILGIDPYNRDVIGFRIELDDGNSHAQIPLSEEYVPRVLDGSKRATVRRGHRDLRPGPAQLVSRRGDPIPILIERVVHLTVSNLDDEVAREDGFVDRMDLLAALRSHYPDLENTDPASIVYFRRQEI